MSENLKSKTARRALAVRREPYWNRIENGLYIGYRALPNGAGTWIGRRRGDDGKQQYHSIGTLEDYDDAVKAVMTWASELNQGVVRFDAKVSDACQNYVNHIRIAKSPTSALDAEGRFKRLVYGKPIGNIPLNKLTTAHVRSWLNEQVRLDDAEDEDDIRRSKDSANRNLASFKAALNQALRDRLVATDAAWKTVVPFVGVGKRREYLLSPAERQTLLLSAQDDLRTLITALFLTGARPGEIANARLADFDKKAGTMLLSGKTGRRLVPLSSRAIKFFKEATAHRIGDQPLLVREDGTPWTKDWWKKLLKAAVAAAGLPDEIVLYHIRHAAISEMIAHGMDSAIVAKLAGTSTAMIDKHYGHLRMDKTRAMLDAVFEQV